MSLLSEIVKRVAAIERWISQHTAFEPTNSTCQVSRSTNFPCASGADTAIEFTTDDYDPDDLHSIVANTERITVIVPGVYSIEGYIQWAAAAGTLRRIKLRLNGATILVAHMHDNISVEITASTQEQLAASDYIDMLAYQNSGGQINATKARLALTRIA